MGQDLIDDIVWRDGDKWELEDIPDSYLFELQDGFVERDSEYFWGLEWLHVVAVDRTTVQFVAHPLLSPTCPPHPLFATRLADPLYSVLTDVQILFIFFLLVFTTVYYIFYVRNCY